MQPKHWQLRSKRELIESFIASVAASTEINSAWPDHVKASYTRDVNTLIVDEHLDDSKTHQFITNALQMGMLRTTGSDIDALLPPMSLFGGQRQIAKQRIIDALTHLFDTYYGLV